MRDVFLMYSFSPPSLEEISKWLERHWESPLSYAEEGMTFLSPSAFPPGALRKFNRDEYRVFLGQGERTFLKAREHLKRWEMFSLGWTRILPSPTSLQKGNVVAVQVKTLGIYILNLCRIIEVTDDERCFAFSYGTLPFHAEQGEERFKIRWSPENDEVSYEITALSRPHSVLAKLGYFYTRFAQKKFGRESLARMKRLQSPES